jgi:lysophospholipase L1-like esterase
MLEFVMGRGRAGLVLLAAVAVTGCGGSPTDPTNRPLPPRLLCPADLTVSNVVGASQLVIFTPPVQTSGTTPITIVCTPASGTMFPLGDTTVRCTATDSFNQLGACTFTVSLSPLPLPALTFVAFGDSLTEGETGLPAPGGLSLLFVDTANSYPTKLRGKLQVEFPTQATSVVNAGLGGEDVSTGLIRLPGVLAANQPQALLLLSGYNDLLQPGTSAGDHVAETLGDMVHLAHQSGVSHVFVSTLTPGRDGPRSVDSGEIEEANFLIRSMAAANGAFLVDSYSVFVGREATLVGDDGLHLTPAGNDVLAGAFLDAIKKAAASTPGPLGQLYSRIRR